MVQGGIKKGRNDVLKADVQEDLLEYCVVLFDKKCKGSKNVTQALKPTRKQRSKFLTAPERHINDRNALDCVTVKNCF